MKFEPWMMAAMEEEGVLNTKESHINRLAKYFKENNYTYVGNDEFNEACRQCGISPYSFTSGDIELIKKRTNR